MSYIQRVLQPGETLIYVTKLHWLIYARAMSLAVIAAAIAALALDFGGDWQYPGLVLAAIVLALALFAFILAAIKRASTELAVTDHRVIFKHGLIGRYTIEMARSKVESVDVNQGLMGRLFNFGTILVRGTGGSLEPFRDIEDPLQLRSAITAQ
jgi:uncharacterized membrane protein YdbT with pleckstrin-like domain